MSALPDVVATPEAALGSPAEERHRLEVLWLSPYLPLPLSGAGSRVFNLIRILSASANIDLIATTNEWHERHELATRLRALCRTVDTVREAAPSQRQRRLLQLRSLVSRHPAQYWTHHTVEMQHRIDRAVRIRQYDVAIVEHSFTGYYRVPAAIPIVLDQHNVESEILCRAGQHDRSYARRALNLVEFWKYRSDEQRICRGADLILAVSDRDQAAMQRWRGTPRCRLVPNGVDTDLFVPMSQIREQHGTIVFTGPLHYSPNAEAMLFFGNEIWPVVHERVPHATLTIVGANPPIEIQHLGRVPGISVAGFVPDVRPYLARAQVVVAPLRIGGGTRLKILEALAMRRAVVSTSLGCEGLEVEHGRHLLVANDPREFAECIVELFANSVQRDNLGRQGRALVEAKYDWQAVGKSLDEALRGFVVGRHSSLDQQLDPLGGN